jgi:hypothetical protein
VQNQVNFGPLRHIGPNEVHQQGRFPVNNEPAIQSRISASNQYRLPVIFANYHQEPIINQNNGRQSRSLSSNCLNAVTPTITHQFYQNQQSKVVFQPQPQNINLQR